METKIIQITAGRGPAECGWVVAQVLKRFLESVKHNSIDYKIVQQEKGIENRTLQSVTIQLKAKNLSTFLIDWKGTIQWIGSSTFRPNHKRKNWFIAIHNIKNAQQTAIKDTDILYQATKSSGSGGQHVNKVSSAIRATHKPTRTQVLVMDSRSQHQNKKTAKLRLVEKVNALQEAQLKSGLKNQWENHLNIKRGNPTKVFKGSDFKFQKKEKTYKKQRSLLKADLQNRLNE